MSRRASDEVSSFLKTIFVYSLDELKMRSGNQKGKIRLEENGQCEYNRGLDPTWRFFFLLKSLHLKIPCCPTPRNPSFIIFFFFIYTRILHVHQEVNYGFIDYRIGLGMIYFPYNTFLTGISPTRNMDSTLFPSFSPVFN